jgi:hypothetical protein
MRVRQEHAIDFAHLFQRHVADPGSGVNKHVVVDKKRRGSAVLRNGTGTA